jgi:hypothetical protein
MSPFRIASTLFSLLPTSDTSKATQSGQTKSASGTDFSSSLTLRMAALQAQSVSLLIGSTNGSDKTSSGLDFLMGVNNTSNNTSSSSTDLFSLLGISTTTTGASSLSASGRNLSLFDPESAYNMMSIINRDDVTYKAQYSELSEMKTAVASMQQAGQNLGAVGDSLDNEAIKSSLQDFVTKYNDWITRFDGTVKAGGVLAGTQAAEVSLYELEQSVENPFNGAKDGFRGLSDLGLSIDETTNLASLDTNKLNAALATNKDGAINTISEFGANFAKSAELLNSDNNFIPNRLSNLDRAIDYITANKSSLQAEFGLGAPAKPSTAVSEALAHYAKIAGI